MEKLKERVLGIISDKGLTFNEIASLLSWSGDRRPLRKVLASLVREGKVQRVPDYDKKKMVFRRLSGQV